ncbi:Protease 3 [Thalassocella blandensis]|nr:Protease 3 [Thalassocella blandensis]
MIFTRNLPRALNQALIYSGAVVFFLCSGLLWANGVETNRYDDRTFEALTLDNGLKVLLVFDPSADKAAAALDVNVGSSEDPSNRAGLAHFVEHMLFLGTNKYPSPGDFQYYISENGGSHNAYTSTHHTNYFFDIEPLALNGALDRFAQFFVSPQFQTDIIHREIKALDSEFYSQYESETRRERDVLRGLLVEGHELGKFSMGNARSLIDKRDSTTLDSITLESTTLESTALDKTKDSDVINAGGAAQNSALRDEVQRFFRKHYSADRMTLVVSSPYSIADLKKYVVPKFSELPRVPFTESESNGELLSSAFKGSTLEIQSLNNTHRLSLLFPVPESTGYYEQKPLEFIADILANQGEGSLYTLLVQLGWITDINTRVDYTWHGGETFNVDLYLTDSGLVQTQMIRQLVFDYIALTAKKGVTKKHYKSLAQKGRLYFRFYEKQSLRNSISDLALQLHEIPVDKLVSSRYLYADYDQALIQSYLSYLTPDNALTIITHPFVNIMDDIQMSPYYHAKYIVHEKSDNSFVMGDRQLRQLAAYRKKIKLPRTNEYLSDNIRLVDQESDLGWSQPEILRSKYGVTTWFMPDRVYRQPFTYIKSQWVLPEAAKSAEASASLKVFTSLLEREMHQQLSQAKAAGLQFNLSQNMKGVELEVDGFSENIQQVTRQLSSIFSSALSSRRYRQQLVKKHYGAVYQELLIQERNKIADGAYVKAFRELPETLYKPKWSSEETFNALHNLTSKQFLRTTKSLFDGATTDVLIYGNETSKSAGRLARYFEKIQRKNGSRPSIAPSLVVDISEENYIYIKSMPVSQGDNALMLYVQGHNDDLQEQAKFLMLDQMLRAPFYNTLRTEKQLGYLVQSEEYKLKNVPGLICVVQSPDATAQEIYHSINAFFAEQAPVIFENFYQNRKAVLAKLDQQPQSQSEVAQRYWLSIKDGDVAFDAQQKLRDIVANMSIYRMKKFYYSRVLNKSGRVLFVGNQGEINAQSFEKNALLITDAFTFKNSMPVYLYP